MTMKLIYRLLFLLLFAQTASAQFDSISVKKLMWGDPFEGFKKYDIPEKWKGESAVILGRKFSYSVSKEPIASLINEEQYLHERIKLLDNGSVKKYSEFDFESNFGYIGVFKATSTKSVVFVGIKVIKADGTQIEIPISQAVDKEIKSGSNKRTFKSIAIPGLVPGDILDYYIAIRKTVLGDTFYGLDDNYFPLVDDYPILKQQFDFKALRKCYLFVRSVNGAPDGKLKRDANNEYVYTITDENRDKLSTSEDPWVYPLRELPLVKFEAYHSSNSALDKYTTYTIFFSKTEDKIATKTLSEDVLKHLNSLTEWQSNAKIILLTILKTLALDLTPIDNSSSMSIRNFLDDKFKKEKDPEKLSKEAYYYYRQLRYRIGYENDILYNTENYYGASDDMFIRNMSRVLEKNLIPHDILFTNPSELTSFDDILLSRERKMIIRVNTRKPFYLCNFSKYSNYNEIDQAYQGNDAYTYKLVKKAKDRRVVKTNKTIPITSASESTCKTTSKVMFDKSSMLALQMHREYLITGLQKEYYQTLYVTPYEYLQECRNDKYDSPMLIDNEYLTKKSRKELTERIAEKTSQDESDRKKRITDYYLNEFEVTDTANITINKIRVDQIGMWDDKSDFKCQTDLKAYAFVKQLGSNYMVEIGKIIGAQRELNEKQQDRSFNINLGYARQFENLIEFEIPNGYTVKGIEKLNCKVENEFCAFVSTAEIIGNKLTIRTIKKYNTNYVAKSNWDKVKSGVDAASNFYHQKVLFEKI